MRPFATPQSVLRIAAHLSVVLFASTLSAATIVGGDYAGGNLSPADNDVLSGTFTNVGTFTVAGGTTVFVASGVPLVVQANTIVIAGTLNGVGSGFAGGPAVGPDSAGISGSGPGAGHGGGFGNCYHSSGGGGGGYGCAGGNSGSAFGGAPSPATGGAAYGSSNPPGIDMGSGGGSAGSHGTSCGNPGVGGKGGAGGGSVDLSANTITVSGSILVDGQPGFQGVLYVTPWFSVSGGGGGSGGGILLNGVITVTGTLSATGGKGADFLNGSQPDGPVNDFGQGGGGGGGGRIKLIGTSVLTSGSTIVVDGGAAGASDTTNTTPATPGCAGTTSITLATDVSVTKSDAPDPVVAGNDITYTLTVTNNGANDALAVSLTDTIPSGTTFVSESQTSGPSFSCNVLTPGSGGTLTCTIATLTASASAVFSLVVHVPASTTNGSTIDNTADVGSTTSDPDDANNHATASTTVLGAVDLSITKSASATTAAAGENVTYTIGITNKGPGTATSVVMTDDLPDGMTLVSATPSVGNCSGTSTVVCTIPSLANGASASIEIVVTVTASTEGDVSNQASVSSAESDQDNADNASSAVVAVTTPVIPTASSMALALLFACLAAAGAVMLRTR